MTTSNPPVINVWLPLEGAYVVAGYLYVRPASGGQDVSFRYDPEYLHMPGCYSFDPAFDLHGATQVHPAGALAGAFSDCQPDRWGRHLIQRSFRIFESEQSNSRGGIAGRAVSRSLQETDYLLGISDRLRMGALRFSVGDDHDATTATFMASKTQKFAGVGPGFYSHLVGDEIPPVTELSTLAHLSRQAEGDKSFTDLRRLAGAGSSLGGARPKVNVVDDQGRLWIAKFSSLWDDYSTIAWEYVALSLAQKAGLHVPDYQLLHIDHHPVLLTKRFDRTGDTNPAYDRVPYMSAMTLLGVRDGQGSSYVEIADELLVADDRQELFARAVFGLLIGNCDDHLRNHGLVRINDLWRLSPLFDVNPSLDTQIHATRISPFNADSLAGLLDSAEYFSLSRTQAADVIEHVKQAVVTWPDVARRAGISTSEQHVFAAVFNRCLHEKC